MIACAGVSHNMRHALRRYDATYHCHCRLLGLTELMNGNALFYLDTSALNCLAERVRDFDFLSGMKKSLGFDFFISPITLWEILLSNDEKKRDFLINWAQFNCAQSLLKSPAEIILSYIESGCPLRDRKFFRAAPYTELPMGVTWQAISGRIDKTIPVDYRVLKSRSDVQRQLSKSLKSIIIGMSDTVEASPGEYNPKNDYFNVLTEKVLSGLRTSTASRVQKSRVRICLILIFFIVCIGFELQNCLVHSFWSALKIDDPLDRLDYLSENHPFLFVRGPALEMSLMIETQIHARQSQNRGLLYDSMHSIYCHYADNFISADEDFRTLRENNGPDIFKNIIMIDELEKVWGRTLQLLKGKHFLT